MDFVEIINRIFVKKLLYKEIVDQDKIDNFFIINRKLGKGFPDMAKRLNNKYIDKASAVDMWFDFFKNDNKIPQWYWDPRDKKKSKQVKAKDKDYNLIKERYDLDEYDITFLKNHFKEELDRNMKEIGKIL